MSEMVERVARRICESNCLRKRIGIGVCMDRVTLRNTPCAATENQLILSGKIEVARAAIAAMREPTEAMCDASRRALGKFIRTTPKEELAKVKGYAGGFRVMDENVKAKIRYIEMIDEALK